jgi:hypothetical protein
MGWHQEGSSASLQKNYQIKQKSYFLDVIKVVLKFFPSFLLSRSIRIHSLRLTRKPRLNKQTVTVVRYFSLIFLNYNFRTVGNAQPPKEK